MRGSREDQLAELRARHPGWYIWFEPNGKSTRWAAGRPSGMVAAYEERSAEELDRDLADDELGHVL